MQYCYCLFCETRKTQKVASALELNGMDRAFSPQILKRQRKQGKNIGLYFDLFHGYVFTYSSQKISKDFMLKVDGVIRVLGLTEYEYCLGDKDYDFALELLNRDGIIDVMSILQVGDTVEILDPLFKDNKGSVLQLDRHKQRANVEFSFSRMVFRSWIACEILYPQKQSYVSLTTSRIVLGIYPNQYHPFDEYDIKRCVSLTNQ